MAIDNSKDNAALANAIRKRNSIVGNTESKYIALDKLLKQNEFEDKSHTLFYVGEGSSIVDEYDTTTTLKKDLSQLQVIAKVITKNGWKLSKFTSLEKQRDRYEILESFKDGSIDALVSMRVLDEGIDIPQCKRAFILASSKNSRQFVQRRGRILRRSDGKEFADIYDFVVLPNSSIGHNDVFRKLVFKELTRVMDFVRLSLNRKTNERKASEIGDRYGISIMEV
ncbi:MAG: hypothetical protein JMN27_18235 [gamma proteobacterium endosymbiont of Lamellibrachia anaximandri]|nr:hypothetical protein [gamma proteobacterium endosymbiont of Lamellibrachia anaximandri]MBL3535744.1 hypothetical protein [gamma proteobacterium endosymbiont of Lamellibrachia anaximandri]